MNTINQILSGIRSVLGVTNTVRSTANSLKREAGNVSKFAEKQKEKRESKKVENLKNQ
jgi:hypothetical protein